MEKFSSAVWKGILKEGKGSITSESGALQGVPISFATRFEQVKGSNPEELIGAAHAACFSMALAAELGKIGFEPHRIDTRATVRLEKDGAGFTITDVYLSTQAVVPNLDHKTFLEAAQVSKRNCPVSKLLNASIHLEATLGTSLVAEAG